MTDICKAALALARNGNHDLTLRQIALLGVVCDQPGQSVLALADALDVSRPVITRANHSLAAMGFITSAGREDDRRKVSVEPTAAGLAFRRELAALA